MIRFHSTLILISLVVSLTGCGGTTDDREPAGETPGLETGLSPATERGEAPDGRHLAITMVERTLTPGSVAPVRLKNLSGRTIGFNLCPRILERRVEESWTPLPETRPAACTLELRLLPAGETVEGTTGIPPEIEPGTYRLVFEGVSFEEGEPDIPAEDRTTDPFEVRVGA